VALLASITLFFGFLFIPGLSLCAAAQDHGCLDKIYPAEESRNGANFRFDEEFDREAGGTFSCDLQMRPSELRIALDRFRSGVLYHDSKSINLVVRFPINAHVSDSLESNAKTKSITIRNADEWYSFQDRYMTPIQKALVACAYLDNVTATGGRSPGVMIGLGAFWFQSFVGSWRVKMTAVNIYPVTGDQLAKSCIAPGAEKN
jgi:hypothetical protein